MLAYREFALLASAARTATGEGSNVDTFPGEREWGTSKCRALLSVTAASGTTPTLDVTIVATINGVETVVGTFTQKTAAGEQSIVIDCAPQLLKAKYTIGGTGPSFTFSVQVARG